MGMPIMTKEMGKGMSCLKTRAMKIPIEDAEKAVKLSLILQGSILMCKGTLWYFVTSE